MAGGLPRQALADRHRALAVGIGLNHAGVDREPLATDQALGDAAHHRRLEQHAQKIAIAEAAVAVLEEGRVVGHRAIETQPAEPSVSKVEMNFLAQPPLGADAERVADEQHADHQLGVDRCPPGLAVNPQG